MNESDLTISTHVQVVSRDSQQIILNCVEHASGALLCAKARASSTMLAYRGGALRRRDFCEICVWRVVVGATIRG